jgi:hypothetical protein
MESTAKIVDKNRNCSPNMRTRKPRLTFTATVSTTPMSDAADTHLRQVALRVLRDLVAIALDGRKEQNE